MKKFLLTDNSYLCFALSETLQYINSCIVDLDCCSSLSDISQIVSDCGKDNTPIILMGSRGIYVELFSCFGIIDMKHPVETVIKILREHVGIEPKQLEEYILSCRTLDKLTASQVNICLLDLQKKIATAPTVLNLTISSIYRNIGIAAEKLNFKTLLYFRYFISKEFSENNLEILI